MARLLYIGGSNRYTLESADLKRHGVEGFSKTTWEAKNGFAADVSDDAANKIVELMPKDFEIEGAEKAVDDSDEPDGDDASSSDAGSSKKRPKTP